MNITIEGFGTFLAKKGKRIVIKQGRKHKEFAIYKIDSLLIDTRGVSFSSNLIKELQKEKINILFLDGDKPIAFVNYLNRNPLLTKKQLLMPDKKKMVFAKEIISKKVSGQMAILKSLKKTGLISSLDDEEKTLRNIKEEIERLENKNFDQVKNTIFALEAEFAQKYWAKLVSATSPEYNFTQREKRPARDSLNASLNYGYAILSSKVLSAILKAGLDPTIGVLHALGENRNSLVFDLMEPYRPLIDRAIITLFTKKIFSTKLDFNLDEFRLTKTGKEKVIEKSISALNKTSSVNSKQMAAKKAILFTCYNFKNFLAGNKYFYAVIPK